MINHQAFLFSENDVMNRRSAQRIQPLGHGSPSFSADLDCSGKRPSLDTHQVAAGRQIWLHIIRGAVTLNLVGLTEGDGAAISDEENVKIEATEESEILLFDMA